MARSTALKSILINLYLCKSNWEAVLESKKYNVQDPFHVPDKKKFSSVSF